MYTFYLPNADWTPIFIAAAPFVLIAAKYLLYRWLAKLLHRSVAEFRKELNRLEDLIAELKAALKRS